MRAESGSAEFRARQQPHGVDHPKRRCGSTGGEPDSGAVYSGGVAKPGHRSRQRAWIDVFGAAGARVGTVIAFTIDRSHPTAAGSWGGFRRLAFPNGRRSAFAWYHDADMERLGGLIAAIPFEYLDEAA